jgi:hypothetical protein
VHGATEHIADTCFGPDFSRLGAGENRNGRHRKTPTCHTKWIAAPRAAPVTSLAASGSIATRLKGKRRRAGRGSCGRVADLSPAVFRAGTPRRSKCATRTGNGAPLLLRVSMNVALPTPFLREIGSKGSQKNLLCC